MNNIFELIENNNEQVIVKVNAKDPLTIARNPFVQANYEYITVTKGQNHTLTVIKNDGSTFSFHWGINSRTCISQALERLKTEVVKFIESEMRIPLELNFVPTDVKIYYNPNFSKWQITFVRRGKSNAHLWPGTGDLSSTINVANGIIKRKLNYVKEIAVTGINVWKACVK